MTRTNGHGIRSRLLSDALQEQVFMRDVERFLAFDKMEKKPL